MGLKLFALWRGALFIMIVIALPLIAAAASVSVLMPEGMTYEIQGSGVTYRFDRRPDGGARFLLTVGREFRDASRALDRLVLPGGQSLQPEAGLISIPYRFAVFHGESDIGVALPNGKTWFENTGPSSVIQRIEVDSFDAGRSALIRVHERGPGEAADQASLRRILAVVDGRPFRVVERLAEFLQKARAGSPESPTPRALFAVLKAETAAIERNGGDTLLSRLQVWGIDSIALSVQPNSRSGTLPAEVLSFASGQQIRPPLSPPIAARRDPGAAAQPQAFTLGRTPTAPRVDSARNATRALPTDVTAIDEEGQTVPAINVVSRFARDMIERARTENWAYDEVPWLREIEDKIMRSWLTPEAGSARLLGPSGVGKDFLMKRIAVRLLRGDCPNAIREFHLWEFEAGSLQAGTRLRGQEEARIRAAIALSAAVRHSLGGTALVFSVSEANELAKGDDRRPSILDQLKPAMAEGNMRLVMNATPEDWTRDVRDGAINRRSVRIELPEPSGEKLYEILRARWKARGQGELSEELMQEAARLADLYATEGAQPSRTTALFGHMIASRLWSGDQGPWTKEGLIQCAKEFWRIPEAEFDPALRIARHEQMARELRLNIVGQRQPIETVLQQDRIVLARLNDPRLPRMRILFVGDAGLGKTEIASIVSRVVTGDTAPLRRIMLNAYRSADDIAKLKRELVEASQENPHGVLVFDEVDKATREAQDVLLSVWDTGVLVVNEGGVTRLARFHNMRLIGAANYASDFIARLAAATGLNTQVQIGFQSGLASPATPTTIQGGAEIVADGQIREQIRREGMSPYLLDRAAAIGRFEHPSQKEFAEVILLHTERALKAARENAGLELRISNAATMAEDLARAFWQPGLSNREAVRIVQTAATGAIANIRFDAERASLAGGGDGRDVKGFELQWKDGALTATGPLLPEPRPTAAASMCGGAVGAR